MTIALRVLGRDTLPQLPGGGPYLRAISDDYFATAGIRRVFLLVAVVLLVEGLLASAIPAWRAARVDLIEALRAE